MLMVGVGLGQETCQNGQCSRKPTLEDYQHMLDVSTGLNSPFIGMLILDVSSRSFRRCGSQNRKIWSRSFC